MHSNSVRTIKTDQWELECEKSQEILEIKRPLVVTSKGNFERLALSKFYPLDSIFCDVESYPSFVSCQKAIDFALKGSFDGVVSIGGGSVLDTAKTAMAALGSGLTTPQEILGYNGNYDTKVASIFVPTTHGTGSEVTMWGTVWDKHEMKKYSISHKDLYPDIAILDGFLTLSLPLDISITTCLDAMSHAFEAIWNKNRNQHSTELAIEAICLILENVGELKKNRRNLESRRNLLLAANLAGRAISKTKTAAAHSISYPLTLRYGIPHGVACSLPLLPLIELNERNVESELSMILDRLQLKDLAKLSNELRFISKGVLKFSLREWGIKRQDLTQLVARSFTKGRMDNHIVKLTPEDILFILESIY